MRIEVQYFEGCPNHAPAIELVRQLLKEEAISAEVSEVNVSDASTAQDLGFLALRASAWMGWMWNQPHVPYTTTE